MRASHATAHALTVAGFGAAVWWVGDIRITAAGMVACLTGIAWWVIAQCTEGTP